MKECREIQALLPEYVADRPMANRGIIALHLDHCADCRTAHDDLELVFTLLSACPEPPASLYGEANARLALQTALGPGPLRSNESALRRETWRFRICSVLSLAGAGSLACGATALINMHGLHRWKPGALNAEAMEMGQRALAQIQAIPLWEGLALFTLIGGLASMLPVLMLNSPSSSGPRRPRREV